MGSSLDELLRRRVMKLFNVSTAAGCKLLKYDVASQCTHMHRIQCLCNGVTLAIEHSVHCTNGSPVAVYAQAFQAPCPVLLAIYSSATWTSTKAEQLALLVLQLGIELIDQGRFERALGLFDDGLNLNSTYPKLNASLHSNKAYALMKLKRYALAIVECCKAIDLDQDAWRPCWVRHAAWRDVGLFTRAAEVCVVQFNVRVACLFASADL